MTTNAKKNDISAMFGIVFSGGSSVSISIHECFHFNFSRYELFHRFLWYAVRFGEPIFFEIDYKNLGG